jgi:phosphate transport system substrate-binding protein
MEISVNMKFIAYTAAAAVGMAAFAGAASARDQIRIVGSSTVYPFTTAVAEQFGKSGAGKTPVVESTGTGGGMKLFCAGVGEDHPDLTNASRAMKKGEYEDCQKNGVKDIVEIKVGIDGLTIAQSKAGPATKLTRQQVFQALAEQVPDKDGKLVANPYKNWSDIDPSLPNVKIEVLGPPPTSGTRDSFHELFLEKGAEAYPALKDLKKSDSKAFDKIWKSIRKDGAYVEAGENDNVIVQKPTASSATPSSRRTPPSSRASPSRASSPPTTRSRAASTRARARSSSTPRSSTWASSPASTSSSPSTCPRRPCRRTATSRARASSPSPRRRPRRAVRPRSA